VTQLEAAAPPSWATEPAVEVRSELVQHWLRREQHERQVGAAFATLARLLADWAAPAVLSLLTSGAREEERHADVCHELARAYAGYPLPAPERLSATLSDFGTGDSRLELSLNVVGLCCINETIATAWLRHCLAIATVPELAAIVRAHLSDEIQHARAGWAHIASPALTLAERAVIAERLPQLVEVNAAQWLNPDNFLSGNALPTHGQPSAQASQRVIALAIDELVWPGFRHVGLV
jgi:hypothetical protein